MKGAAASGSGVPAVSARGRPLAAMGTVGRLAAGLVTLLLVTVLVFALLELAPGGAAGALDDPSLPAADRERLAHALGLDRPAPVRYLAWLAGAAQGDLGVSASQQRPVARALGETLPPTLLLTGGALVVALALGLACGTRAATRPRGAAAFFVRTLLPALDALPPFWLGSLAVLVFAWRLGWLPASHMRSVDGGPGALLDLAWHLVLPLLVVAVPAAAPVARHHAAAMAAALASPAARTARALGLDEVVLVRRHAFRLALRPTIVLLGLALPALAGGAAVVEVVFSWPGLGQLQHRALLARDAPLALGALLLYGTLVIAGGLLADLLAARIDPRAGRAETDA